MIVKHQLMALRKLFIPRWQCDHELWLFTSWFQLEREAFSKDCAGTHSTDAW